MCLALGNAYSAALQQDKAVDALRAGLSAIEQMPAAAQWDNDRYCLHINIGNQYLKERLAQLCITECKDLDTAFTRSPHLYTSRA